MNLIEMLKTLPRYDVNANSCESVLGLEHWTEEVKEEDGKYVRFKDLIELIEKFGSQNYDAT